MTFAELKAEVLRRLREAKGTYDSTAPEVFWRDTDVEVALNDAYMEISDSTEWNEQSQTVELLESRPYYDARTLLRKPFLVLGPAYNHQTSRWLIPTRPLTMDEGDLRWEQRVAEPERLLVRGLWWISYWPYKGVEGGRIKQMYKALPDPMEDDGDVPGFHRNYHYGLVEYALFDLFAQDGETDLAWASWKLYLEYEQGLWGHVQSRSSIPLRHGWADSAYGS